MIFTSFISNKTKQYCINRNIPYLRINLNHFQRLVLFLSYKYNQIKDSISGRSFQYKGKLKFMSDRFNIIDNLSNIIYYP